MIEQEEWNDLQAELTRQWKVVEMRGQEVGGYYAFEWMRYLDAKLDVIMTQNRMLLLRQQYHNEGRMETDGYT